MVAANILDKFSLIEEYWSPKIVGELNGQYIKLAKLKGDFTWHKHENEDEFFMVVKGVLVIEFKDKTITLNENEFLIVPKGVEHLPRAMEEVWILLFEPVSTLNTGDKINEFTKKELDNL